MFDIIRRNLVLKFDRCAEVIQESEVVWAPG